MTDPIDTPGAPPDAATAESGTLYRVAAFAETPGGGNPAGVWTGRRLPDAAIMQSLAAEVGYSETAFLAPGDGGEDHWKVRYFSPEMEVPFCGHATIASGVALGETLGPGLFRFDTPAGEIPVSVQRQDDGVMVATLTSVEPSHAPVEDGILSEVLRLLGWKAAELDPTIPPAVAFAGARHLVLAAGQRSTLARLDYDFKALEALMRSQDWITLQLIWRQDDVTFHSRNPFPVGGVVEDPATGASAAALGGYLRELGAVTPPARMVIHQGDDMGRPSRLHVDIPPEGGISVTGRGLFLDAT